MSQLNKVLLALGISILITLIIVGAYYLFKGDDKSSSDQISSKKDTQGPYYHKIYSASSLDGLTWTKNNQLLFDHASVPGAVVKDGKVYQYFVDASGETDQLSVAISSDNGKTFAKQQEVKIKDTNKWDSVDPHPELVDNKIRLYYFGNFSSMAKEDNNALPTMYSTESSDGINFDDVKEVYKNDDTKQVITDPDVFETSNDWRMLVSKGKNMDLAISKDGGITFTQEKNFSWDKGSVSDTFNFNGLYRTYYCGPGGILSATGTDKGTSAEESGVRISSDDKVVCDPSVVKLTDGTYLMFYKVQDITQQQGQQGPQGGQGSQQKPPGALTPSQQPGQSPNTQPSPR